jgi:hypothetical protein
MSQMEMEMGVEGFGMCIKRNWEGYGRQNTIYGMDPGCWVQLAWIDFQAGEARRGS